MSDFILGVDLDGVCGDHAEAFRRVVAQERGVDVSSLPPQETWDFTEWEMDRAEFERLHRLAVVEHRMFRTMPVIPGAAETLWRLSDAGVWIRLITHRLYTNWGHAVAVADTVDAEVEEENKGQENASETTAAAAVATANNIILYDV